MSALTYDQAREAIMQACHPYCGHGHQGRIALHVAEALDVDPAKALAVTARELLPAMQANLYAHPGHTSRMMHDRKNKLELETAIRRVRALAEAGKE